MGSLDTMSKGAHIFMVKRLNTYFYNCNHWQLILFPIVVCILVNPLINHISSSIIGDLQLDTEREYYEKNSLGHFVIAVIIGPPFETLIFQAVPFFLLSKAIKNPYFIVLILGLLFGIPHYFNEQSYSEALGASFAGLIYAYIYYIAKRRKDTSAFFTTTAIHGGYNLFVFLLKYITYNLGIL